MGGSRGGSSVSAVMGDTRELRVRDVRESGGDWAGEVPGETEPWLLCPILRSGEGGDGSKKVGVGQGLRHIYVKTYSALKVSHTVKLVMLYLLLFLLNFFLDITCTKHHVKIETHPISSIHYLTRYLIVWFS